MVLRLTPFCLLALLALTSCESLFGSSPDTAKSKDEGKRVAVLESAKKLSADEGLKDSKPSLPPPMLNKDWPQAGGNTAHTLLHPALSAKIEKAWSADIGDGSNGDYRLLAQPVVKDGKVFTLDAQGRVSAFSTDEGDRLWRTDTTPPDHDEAMGAGLGVAGDTLYVTTGLGEVLALRVADGGIVWRKMLGKPFRAAPTIAEGRVYVVSIENELNALDAATGEVLWHHNGIAESATLMGAAAPAAAGDSVVVAYSSGEIFNLRAQNGRVAWTDVLAVPAQVGALPAIADIRGLPVMDRGRVFAISHSGRMAAIDERTGDRAWEADVGGINTPLVSGDTLFVLSNDSELIALVRDSGRIRWIRELQRREDAEDRDSDPVSWWGPVLAGGRLWLTNSLGHLVAFSPLDGGQVEDHALASSFFIPPVVSDNTLYVVSDGGDLVAVRESP